VTDRYKEGNNEQNTNQIQTLGSLTDCSSHIRLLFMYKEAIGAVDRIFNPLHSTTAE